MTALTDTKFHEVFPEDELWDGEMDAVEINGTEILIVKHEGAYQAFQGVCPHQEVSLVEGKFEDGVIECRAHLWQFDAADGAGINPTNCKLKQYPVKIEGGNVLIGETPLDD